MLNRDTLTLEISACACQWPACRPFACRHAQQFRSCLQSKGSLDLGSSLLKDSKTVLLPILPSCLPQLDLLSLTTTAASGGPCEIVWSRSHLEAKTRRGRTSGNKLEKILQEVLESHGERWTEELRGDLPRSFQRHGDLLLVGDNCFSLPLWRKMDQQIWSVVAKGLGAKRLAKMSRISRDGCRSPVVTVLLGEHSWIKHVDNRISYEFDVTRCMFSAGSITEKLRVAGFDCRGETVVDLYAGGITDNVLDTSPSHACEWNPDAVKALQKNLEANGVSDRCTVHRGDSRQLLLCAVAERVNLGLLPSSEDGWPVACRLLNRTTGGILHIHQNVTSASPIAAHRPSGKRADREAWRAWADDAAKPHRLSFKGHHRRTVENKQPARRTCEVVCASCSPCRAGFGVQTELSRGDEHNVWRRNRQHVSKDDKLYSWFL